MKKTITLILLSLITFVLSDPFKEFDKTFLYKNLSKKSNWSDISQNDFKSACMNVLDEKTDSYDDRKIFCDCTLEELMSVFSEQEFVLEMSYISENKNISDNFNENLVTKTQCLNNFVEEIVTSINKSDKSTEKSAENTKEQNSNKKDKNSFEEKIKDLTKIEGLFTFYIDNDENKALMEISPNQIEKIYLLSITRQSGDAYHFDGSSMQGEYPIMFKKVGNMVQWIEVNVKFRADENLAINKAVKNHISNSIIASSKIISKPNKETGSILIDASNFFITDIGRLSMIKNAGYKFDKSNKNFLMHANWPSGKFKKDQSMKDVEKIINVISELRSFKNELNVSPGSFIDISINKINKKNKTLMTNNEIILKKLGRINNFFDKDQQKPSATLVISGDVFKIYFDENVDLNLIKENLVKRQNKYQEEMDKISQRLSNKGFTDRAPKNIVEQEKTNYSNLKDDIKKISLTIESL